MSLTTITAAERAEREKAVEQATHSLAMEGLTPSEESQQDDADYIAGKIDSAELVARARARYGLD
ncbi:antitoxin VbhA family protein [Microbacterium sp.]|uniref:antitoxin VbhA family protein n=1 Tax=Microbacterium sp. TaxID=51671 RepID=UPI0039E5E139